MLKWEKIGRRVKADGSGVTTYGASGKTAGYRIESRKRAIAHASRSGSWLYTTYFLIVGGQEKEYQRLQDAKAAAEKMEETAK